MVSGIFIIIFGGLKMIMRVYSLESYIDYVIDFDNETIDNIIEKEKVAKIKKILPGNHPANFCINENYLNKIIYAKGDNYEFRKS